jgi:hypothetical protein
MLYIVVPKPLACLDTGHVTRNAIEVTAAVQAAIFQLLSFSQALRFTANNE